MNYSEEELSNIPAILRKTGGKMMERLSHSILNSQHDRLPTLTEIAFSEDEPFNWRACWVIDRMCRERPHKLLPWILSNTERMNSVSNSKQAASLLNMLSRMKVEDAELTPFFDFACKWANVVGSDNANYYALKLMVRIANHIPELKREVKLFAEEINKRAEKPYLAKYTNMILKS